MFLKHRGKFVLKAMSIAMLFASGFSWWQAKIGERFAGHVFWKNFLVMETIFAALICVVTATLLLAHYLDQDLK
jgi:hypothetical protein